MKKPEYFGKYGKIFKVVINQNTVYSGAQVSCKKTFSVGVAKAVQKCYVHVYVYVYFGQHALYSTCSIHIVQWVHLYSLHGELHVY